MTQAPHPRATLLALCLGLSLGAVPTGAQVSGGNLGGTIGGGIGGNIGGSDEGTIGGNLGGTIGGVAAHIQGLVESQGIQGVEGLMESLSRAQFDSGSIDSLADAARGFAESQGIDGVEGLIESAAKAAKSYDGDLFEDLTALAESYGFDVNEMISLLSTQRQANQGSTEVVTDLIDRTRDTCRRLPRTHRIDCVEQGLSQIGKALPRSGDYADVRRALTEVAQTLSKIERNNLDRTAARLRLAKSRSARRYRATTVAALALADEALRGAELKLLRSAPSGDPRHVHYQKIAAALGATALLMRS